MAEGFYQLTYRDLADRLGISPDAARMKANRKAKAGLWRFLPDEGHGQERRIEIPVADLDNLPKRVRPDEPAAPAEQAPNAVEQAATPERGGDGDELASTLSARVTDLTDRLVGEIEGREKDREALTAAEAREEQLKAEIERLCNRVSELTEALEQPRRSFWKRIVQGSSGTEG